MSMATASIRAPEGRKRRQNGSRASPLPFADKDDRAASRSSTETALLEVVKNPPSLEVKRRAEAVVRKLQETRTKGPWTVSGEALRNVRAVEVLERIGSAEAADVLTRLAKGSPYAVRHAKRNAPCNGSRNAHPALPSISAIEVSLWAILAPEANE